MLVGIAGFVVRRERAVGFPVGDRRAAMLVGIAGIVGGRACAVGFPVGERRAAMLGGCSVDTCGLTRARAVVLVGAT